MLRTLILVLIFSIVATTGIMTYKKVIIDEYPKHDKIAMVEIGMNKSDLFSNLGEKKWISYNTSGFEYQWKYQSPGNGIKTFVVVVNNKDKVTIFYSY